MADQENALRFRKGQLTTDAHRQFPLPKESYAIVDGYSLDLRCIRIRKVGHRSVQTYHHTFWKSCTEDEIREAFTRDAMRGGREKELADFIAIG